YRAGLRKQCEHVVGPPDPRPRRPRAVVMGGDPRPIRSHGTRPIRARHGPPQRGFTKRKGSQRGSLLSCVAGIDYASTRAAARMASPCSLASNALAASVISAAVILPFLAFLRAIASARLSTGSVV